MKLNPQQRRAITQTEKPMLVLAGAGSGKTGVITRKIVWLVEKSGLPPTAIYAVTFTNKAAAEMKQRLKTMLDSKTSSKVSVSTFHRLGLKILHRDFAAAGLRRGFTILDQGDCQSALRNIINEHQLGLDEKLLVNRISDWKNRFVTPELALKTAADEFDQRSSIAYSHYVNLLLACNSVDFDDLICHPVTLLRNNHDIRDQWQSRARHLLIDEYQDTNAAQYELIKLLVGPFSTLTAVGDDDQSIYSWRGANPENMKQLAEDFPGLEVVKLEQNYRSSQRILRSANKVIAENPHLHPKRLWSEQAVGDPVRISVCDDALDEADWVASDILSLKFRKNIKYGDMAILYRSNFQSRLFEQALREKQIPYHISGGSSFFDRAEIKDVLAYFKLMVNPDDDTAFLRIVNTPRREIGPSTLEKLGNFSRDCRQSLLNACHHEHLSSVLSARAYKRLHDFANWVTLAADNASRGDIVKVIRGLLDDIDYFDWIESQATSKEAGERSIGNVEELIGWIERQCQATTEGEPEFTDIVSQICLQDLLSHTTDEEGGDQVHMMTLHAAKGLEFPHVYLTGAEENILPHKNSIESDDLEEERRLAYVGMTRAQYCLTFTRARARQKFGETTRCEPSRFLADLPEDDVHEIGQKPTEASEARNAEAGRETLDSLKALLEGN